VHKRTLHNALRGVRTGSAQVCFEQRPGKGDIHVTVRDIDGDLAYG